MTEDQDREKQKWIERLAARYMKWPCWVRVLVSLLVFPIFIAYPLAIARHFLPDALAVFVVWLLFMLLMVPVFGRPKLSMRRAWQGWLVLGLMWGAVVTLLFSRFGDIKDTPAEWTY